MLHAPCCFLAGGFLAAGCGSSPCSMDFQASAGKPIDARPVAGTVCQNRRAHPAFGADLGRLRWPERAHHLALGHLQSDASRHRRRRRLGRPLNRLAPRRNRLPGHRRDPQHRRGPIRSPARHKRPCWWEGTYSCSASETPTYQASSSNRLAATAAAAIATPCSHALKPPPVSATRMLLRSHVRPA